MASTEASLGQSHSASSRNVALVYAAVFIFALVIRLCALGAQNLWHDEHMSLRVASVPLHEMSSLLRTLESNKPPLYFTFLHYWITFATSEFWLRLPSAILGSLGCVLAAAVGKELFSLRLGAWTGLLVALSPFHIYYSQEARPFAMWGFLMGAALLCHLKFCAKPHLALLVGYVVFSVLACYTFTYAFFIVGFSCLFSLSYRPALSIRRLVQIGAANVAILLLFVPWLLRIFSAISQGEGLQVHRRGTVIEASAYSFLSLGLGTSFGPSMETLRLLGRRVFQEAPVGAALLVCGCVVLALLVCWGLYHLWSTHRNAFGFAAAGMVVFWGSPALLNLLKPEIPYNPRYAYPAVIPLAIALVAGWNAARARRLWGWPLLLALSGGVALSLINHFFNPAYARDDLRAAARFLRGIDPPLQKIVVCAGPLSEVFRYYYRADAKILPLTADGPDTMNEVLRPTFDLLQDATHVALVYSRPDHGDPSRGVPNALKTRYRQVGHRHWTGVDVYIFQRF